MDASKLDPQLITQLCAGPRTPVRLIVRVSGKLEQRTEELSRRGIVIHRRLRLIKAVAAEATGEQALALSDEPWVTRIEEDRPLSVAPGPLSVDHGPRTTD